MPRDGSPKLPAGVVPAEPMNVGEVADPPFAVLPNPTSLFKTRAGRFASLAPGHDIEPYLGFMAQVAEAQHAITAELPPPTLPPAAEMETALAHGMPPIALGRMALDGVADAAFEQLVAKLKSFDLPPGPRAAVEAVAAADTAHRRGLMQAIIADEIPEDAVAEHVLAAAALQVHCARLAATLDADKLTRVADGACPACGGAPASSMIVGWEGAHGTRFCTCSICATHWHVSRIKCLVCGTEKGIAYHSLEGSPGVVMGETCEECRSYVKMLHQHKDVALEPIADDVASLGLDLTLQKEGWQRASVNPFLMGY